MQVFPLTNRHELHVKNTKSGKVHIFISNGLDDPTDGPRGITGCGIIIFDQAQYEITAEEDKITCKNCLHPGHNNLWADEYDDFLAYS